MASVEDTDTASGDLQVKVVVAQVAASVGDLDDHLLALDLARAERQLVATAAEIALGLSADACSSETV